MWEEDKMEGEVEDGDGDAGWGELSFAWGIGEGDWGTGDEGDEWEGGTGDDEIGVVDGWEVVSDGFSDWEEVV